MSIADLPANVYTTLSGHSGITALVSDRIDPIQRGQQGTDPFVVYQLIGDTAFNILSNAGGGGKRNARVQITSFSPTHAGAYALAEQVRLAMRDATLFSSVYLMTFDSYEPDTKLYSVIADYSVMTT